MSAHKSIVPSAMMLAALLLLAACGLFSDAPTNGQGENAVFVSDTPAYARNKPSPTPVVQTETTVGEVIGDSVSVSRALAAKMLALAFYDMNEINALDREITFTDTAPELWYDKYINAVYLKGCMPGAEDCFDPNAPLSFGQARDILAALCGADIVAVSDVDRDKPISYALWVDLYKRLLTELAAGLSMYDAFAVGSRAITPLATPGSNSRLPAWQSVTDTGAYAHDGLDLDAYVDKTIQVLTKDNEIIALVSLVSDTPTLRNAYIVDTTASDITIFCGGAERTYAWASGAVANGAGQIGDLVVRDGTALSVAFVSETLTGKLMQTTADRLELETLGIFAVDSQFKTYSVADGPVKWKQFTHLIVGTDMARYYVRDGIICAAVITSTPTPETIRVVIGASNYAGYIHNAVTVTSDEPFTVTVGGKQTLYQANQNFSAGDTISTDGLFDGTGENRIYIRSDAADGKLRLVGLGRNWSNSESPAYRGILELTPTDGGFMVVNELPIESYLYAVIPSEMPSGYGLEASKAQAVTARSYAYNQFYENRFHAYGGNVDDSVSCQVYNNVPENETSIRAVDETRGLCLTYNGQVIIANFFSTSSGMTANSGEVWALGGRIFPTATSPYLRAASQLTDANTGDLSQEDIAAAFFKNNAITAYDSAFPWFRWSVEMTAEELAASINANIKARYEAVPSLIKTWQPEEQVFRSRPVEHIGELVELTVTKRGEGGNIMEMKITGTEAIILVSAEYNIRMLLRPARYIEGGRNINVRRADGSTVANFSLMPSAFFTMDPLTDVSGGLLGYAFYGGGYGHGVGMSQNGVKGMIDSGYSYEAVLRHFYQGTEITKKY